MNRLKKLPLALTVVGLGAMSSFAEIKVTDNLGVSGFLDMSAGGETDDVDSTDPTLSASFDQFELDFMYKFGDKVTARADINAWVTNPNGPSEAMVFEQGFVTANLGAVSLSAGRFLSSSGFEAAEPTGLYQYSWSNNLFYGGYQNGVNVNFAAGMVNLYGAVVTDLWAASETELLNSPGFEGQVSVTPVEGLTAKAAYLYQMYDGDTRPNSDDNQQLLNVWGSYGIGNFLFAAEYNLLLSWQPDATVPAVNDETGHGWLVMTNMKFGPIFALTLRHSGNIIGDDADPVMEVTVSPSLTLSPNWLILAENRYQFDPMVNKYAIESLFSF